MITVAIYDDLKTTGIKKDVLKKYRKHVQPAMITNHQMYSVGHPKLICPAVVWSDFEEERIFAELTILDKPKEVLKILHREMSYIPNHEKSVTEFIKVGTTEFVDLDIKGVSDQQNVFMYRWMRDVSQWRRMGGEWLR